MKLDITNERLNSTKSLKIPVISFGFKDLEMSLEDLGY